jgi:hypothetical protein
MNSEGDGTLDLARFDAQTRPTRKELNDLADRVQQKRTMLFLRAQLSQSRKRRLQAGSGMMALLSGLVASAIFAELLGAT